MSNIFIDSNIWVYAFIETENNSEKRARILAFLNNIRMKNMVIVSVQVLNEFHWILKRKYVIDEMEIRNKVRKGIVKVSRIVPITYKTYDTGCRIREKLTISYWDSLIIASALENNCSILCSEDMQDGQMIENRLKIINPFEQNAVNFPNS